MRARPLREDGPTVPSSPDLSSASPGTKPIPMNVTPGLAAMSEVTKTRTTKPNADNIDVV